MLRMMLAASATLFALSQWTVAADKPDPRLESDIEYARIGDVSLKLDVYLPNDSQASHPVVIFVHGGGWKNGSKASAEKRAAWLTEHGFAVVGINYRLTDVAGWPAQIDDCYAAVRWVRTNADRFNFNPDRIGCWGTSAGAHLAALMGTRRYPGKESVSSAVQAVCDWFGPSELLTMPPNNVGKGLTEQDVANSNGAKLLRQTVREVPELARDASALDQVSPDDPPFLIMHGDQDTGVPIAQSLKLHKRLGAAGVPSTLHVIAGAGHGGKGFATNEAQHAVLTFFQRELMSVWPQGSGPTRGFSVDRGNPPASWSVVRNENIRWRKTLPETGQSTVTVWNDRIFFTTLQEVSDDAKIGKDIVAWCCEAKTGKTLWKRTIPGDYPLRLSGCFSDSSSPPAVTDGKHVVFFNASGRIACFDFAGKPCWQLETMAVGRSQPFLFDGAVLFTRQQYMPDAGGHFTHEHKNAPLDQWTQLQAIELATGETRWTSTCGVNMGSVPLPARLHDGREVIVVGRGGGHGPPEHPEGLSMIDARDGSTIWTLPLEGFMSTMGHNIHGDHVLAFHDDEHLWIRIDDGEIERRVSFLKDVPVCRHQDGAWEMTRESLPAAKKKRAIIQQSNILIGDYHYFRSYTRPYLGRVDARDGKVEYLQLPVQLRRDKESDEDQLLWDPSQLSADQRAELTRGSKKPSKTLPIQLWAFAPNDMKNSRGFVVMGDARSQGTGWGHHASQLPTAIGNRLFVPVMNGTVYAIDWAVDRLDQKAIVAINDLGPVGQSYNRASISYAEGRLFAHTIREVICIEQR